jgi:hypothetical protein
MQMLRDGTIIEQTDSSLGVRFFYLPVEDEVATRESGIAKFRDVEMIEVLIPGNRDTNHRKVKDEDKLRFRQQYERFKESNSNELQGTLLNQFPFISSSRRKELEYLNIFTGEQLINMPDGNIDKIGIGGRELIKKVKAFMEQAKDSAITIALAEKNERLERELELMKQQIQSLMKPKEEPIEGKRLRKSHETAAKAA